jgi:hypothetical protein
MRNQRSNPLKSGTGSNLVDMGRTAVHASVQIGRGDSEAGQVGRLGGHEESLRRTRGEAAGEQLGTSPVNRLVVNVGTIPDRPHLRPAWVVAGRLVVS